MGRFAYGWHRLATTDPHAAHGAVYDASAIRPAAISAAGHGDPDAIRARPRATASGRVRGRPAPARAVPLRPSPIRSSPETSDSEWRCLNGVRPPATAHTSRAPAPRRARAAADSVAPVVTTSSTTRTRAGTTARRRTVNDGPDQRSCADRPVCGEPGRRSAARRTEHGAGQRRPGPAHAPDRTPAPGAGGRSSVPMSRRRRNPVAPAPPSPLPAMPPRTGRCGTSGGPAPPFRPPRTRAQPCSRRAREAREGRGRGREQRRRPRTGRGHAGRRRGIGWAGAHPIHTPGL